MKLASTSFPCQNLHKDMVNLPKVQAIPCMERAPAGRTFVPSPTREKERVPVAKANPREARESCRSSCWVVTTPTWIHTADDYASTFRQESVLMLPQGGNVPVDGTCAVATIANYRRPGLDPGPLAGWLCKGYAKVMIDRS